MNHLFVLNQFNHFVAERYDFADRAEVLLDVLFNQFMLADMGGGLADSRPMTAEILGGGTRQILELYGRVDSAALARMIVLNSGGQYTGLALDGAPLMGAALVAQLDDLVSDYLAFLSSTIKRAVHSTDIMLFTNRLLSVFEQVPVAIDDNATLPLLANAQQAAMVRLVSAFPDHAECILCLPAAGSMVEVVKTYIHHNPRPSALPIHPQVWSALSVKELCKLCLDPDNLGDVVRVIKDRPFSDAERRQLLEASLRHDTQGPMNHCQKLFSQWLGVLPVDTICTYLPLVEQGTEYGVSTPKMLAALKKRPDISDADLIRVLMQGGKDLTEVEATLVVLEHEHVLELEHDVLSHMILTSEWPLNRLSAHLLLNPHDQQFDSSSLQLAATYLDILMRPANLDMFAERAADGRYVGERAMEALSFLSLDKYVKGGVDIVYGGKWVFAHDQERSTGREIMQLFTERFLKQQERLLRRMDTGYESAASRPDDLNSLDIL